MKESEFPINWWFMTRDQLNDTIKDGYYELGDGPLIVGTGKQGVIDYILGVGELIRERINPQ